MGIKRKFFTFGGTFFLLQTVVFVQDLAITFKGFILLRPRWEYVDVETNNRKTANAVTSRFQLGLSVKGKLFSNGFIKFYGEITAVVPLYDRYTPQKKGYEFVADEDGYRITQLYADFGNRFGFLRFGRQVINIDNQRFVGSVNWRQIPQTFDAVGLYLTPLKGLKFETFYIVSRQGVLDKISTAPFEDKPINHSLVSLLTYEVASPLNIGIYSINLNKNSDTYGGFFKGVYPSGGFKLSYRTEYARQITHTANVKDSGNYYHLKGGLAYKTSLGVPFANVGYEYMGEHVITPLATLHKFNGWSDVFLNYIAGSNNYGLKDLYGSVGLKNSYLGKFTFVYHRFRSVKNLPSGGKNFGKEIDLSWSKKVIKNLSVVVKYAKYYADSDAKGSGVGDKDTTKVWLMFVYRYSF